MTNFMLNKFTMRNVFILILIIAVIGISSCHKNSSQGSLKLQINPMFGSKQMRLDSTYQSPDGKYYYFSDMQFFMSHIKFIRADGSSVEVSPLIYVGLDDTANTMPVFTLNNPIGSFVSIQFSIGVDSIQDTVSPSTDPSNPQASNNNMNWGTQLQYVFVKLEGSGDTVNPPLQSIGYHVGTQPYYKTVVLTKSFSTSESSQTTLILNADLQKLFWGSSGAINVLNQSQVLTNTTTNPALAAQFITDFTTIFSFNN
jgi:hypothetical protein